jgi:hypothetical protein
MFAPSLVDVAFPRKTLSIAAVGFGGVMGSN